MSLDIGKYYDFSLPNNAVLGSSFSNARLLSILSYDIAVKFSNVDSLHRQLSPGLPPGTPANYKNYSYYMFSYKGENLVVADAWITTGSIVETTSETRTITLTNVTASKLLVIRDQLNLLGVTFTID